MLHNKLLIISHKFKYRSISTSVEYFCNLLDPRFVDYNGSKCKIPFRLSSFLKSISSGKPYKNWNSPYTSNSVAEELWGLMQFRRRGITFVFFPYADFNYYYFSFFKYFSRSKIILYSYFNIDELCNRFKNLNHFKRADYILVTSREVYLYLMKEFIGIGPKIILFPLGVNTNYFKPSSGHILRQKSILISGSNRRDYRLIIGLIDYFNKNLVNVNFILVGLSNLKDEVREFSNVNCHGYLTDDEFIGPYMTSTIAVLPLLSAASSNSLNEYISCCLPFVYTSLDGMSELDLELFGLPVEVGDLEGFIRATKRLLFDENLQSKIRVNALKYRDELSWDNKLIEFRKLID